MPDLSEPQFAFLVCQFGAERILRQQFSKQDSDFRLAFSRPGLITLKRGKSGENADSSLETWEPPQGLLIRHSGFGLGQVKGEIAEELVDKTLEITGSDWDAFHVFPRDRTLPGSQGFEPGPSEISKIVAENFQKKLPASSTTIQTNEAAPSKILDIVLVEPNHWLIGYHFATEVNARWPGGVFPVPPPARMISRAYLKMAEALAWSELPVQPGDWIVEIGSAPGGASQRLLDLGLNVCGVDPAEMDPAIENHARFEHWRSKSNAIKRKRYSKFRWLAADANVAPNYTLEAVEDIVTYSTSRFQGLLLTVKLTSYDLIEQMDHYLERVHSWGFSRVDARQLSYNRHECCIAALR
ncbi:MAG: SAM-dependent methyltransferase [Planctomycetota bacterium]